MTKLLPATLCALALSLPLMAAAQTEEPVTATTVAKAPSACAAMLSDLANEVQEMVGDASAGVHVVVNNGDTRLERALQEGIVTALFDKGIAVYDAPAPGVVTVRVSSFGAAVETIEDKGNLLSRGVSVVRNVLVADPRVSLVTKPFSRGDARKAPDATIFVTVSVVRSARMTARRTNAYTMPGVELMAQLALQAP